MTIEWQTKKINIQTYYKVIRRGVIINAHNGTEDSGYKLWKKFKDEVRTVILPIEELDKHKHIFAHLEISPNGKMAWGYTGWKEWYWFVTDSRDPRIFMQNVPPGFHELLHIIYQLAVGTVHVHYKTVDPPEVSRAGQYGPAATVIVHDNWYGFKTSVKIWFLHSIWVPTRLPYIPVYKAKVMYNL